MGARFANMTNAGAIVESAQGARFANMMLGGTGAESVEGVKSVITISCATTARFAIHRDS